MSDFDVNSFLLRVVLIPKLNTIDASRQYFLEYSILERYVKVHITQNSQCFTIQGHYHSMRLIKMHFVCTGVVS